MPLRAAFVPLPAIGFRPRGDLSKHPRFYRPELDVLRCLAFLLVFLHHAFLFPPGRLADVVTAGAFGVCVFYFLSAFLITELITRERETTGTLRLGAFYARRILRIWPLYFAALLFDFVHLHYTRPGTFTAARLAAFSLLAGNWYVARYSFIGSLSLPLWSISVEEQFYVVWPSLQRAFSRTVILAFCAVAALAAYIALYTECRAGLDLATRIWANSFVQFQFFATGAAVSLLLRGRTPTLQIWHRISLFVCGLGALYLAQARFHAKLGPTPAEFSQAAAGYLFVNAGCAILFFAFLGATELRNARPLLYLGRVSYGLYVFHFAMLNLCDKGLRRLPQTLVPFALVKAVAALALTVLCASLSWRFFESPILRFKNRFEVIRTRGVAA